ncbi:DUF4387 family protein [Sphingomonas sp. 2SG]|uniref:DUF4387 family protein n=1 Tax=Sphingomonas sp. 2SG TaxID=2502201 RepID=UPI0010FA1EF0|nr:DUF4387 family protein [Sphingomonas sp. 2SG]
MNTVSDVCRYVRSKNAGPFWITVDLFFKDAKLFARHAATETLSRDALARIFRADPAQVKWFAIPNLLVIKFSYPRVEAQGGALERDMHGGQQFVEILDLPLDPEQGR